MAIRPKSTERGVVFALLPHYRIGNVILGLEIRRASFIEGTTISLIHASSKSTRTVFDFTVPDLTGRWTWLSFSIRKNGVTFYKDCKQVEAKFEPSSLGDLTLPRYSALYIGRAGWTPGAPSNAFQVSLLSIEKLISVNVQRDVPPHVTGRKRLVLLKHSGKSRRESGSEGSLERGASLSLQLPHPFFPRSPGARRAPHQLRAWNRLL